MKNYSFLPVVFIGLFSVRVSRAQISPPGLGEAHTSGWMAVALNSYLDSSKTWQSVSYLGYARKSDPDNYNPVNKAAIWVLNHEFYHTFQKNWQYSLALSYRRQNEYAHNSPYERLAPSVQQEFRVYGRLSHTIRRNAFSLTPIYRQEFRKYYTPDFHSTSENLQLRSRMRLKATVNLDKRHKITGNSEQLFSSSLKNDSWTRFAYKESRFSLYYSVALKNLPVTVNTGYMLNLINGPHPVYNHYLALDIAIENPFR